MCEREMCNYCNTEASNLWSILLMKGSKVKSQPSFQPYCTCMCLCEYWAFGLREQELHVYSGTSSPRWTSLGNQDISFIKRCP